MRSKAATPIIDCDADPFCQGGHKVVRHIKGGVIEWKPENLELYLDDQQKSGNYHIDRWELFNSLALSQKKY